MTTLRGPKPSDNARQNEVLELPSDHPEYVDVDVPMRLMPGVFAAQLYPAREEVGGVLLPSRGGGWESEGAAAERVRPDCVTVLAVGSLQGAGCGVQGAVSEGWNPGTARRASAERLEGFLQPGDRVMVRPWSGIRFETAYGFKGLCFFGSTDPWEEDAVMVFHNWEWRPVTNWVAIQFDSQFKGNGLEVAGTHLDVKGTVLDAGPYASVRPGQRVVCADDYMQQSDDDIKWLRTKWGAWGNDVWLVREVDCEGVRRIVAELEESHAG